MSVGVCMGADLAVHDRIALCCLNAVHSLIYLDSVRPAPTDCCIPPSGAHDLLIFCHASCRHHRLRAIAAPGELNLRRLSASELPDLLPLLLPPVWRGAATAAWKSGADGQPTEEWLQLLWTKLQARIFVNRYVLASG